MSNLRTFGLCAAGMSLTLLFLWQQVQATRLGYEITRSQLELRRLRDRTSYLRLEMERLITPEKLADRARRRLGMAPPSPECLVFIGSRVPRPSGRIASAAEPKARPLGRIVALLSGR
ncbi:MAG: hypothetical protein ABIJ96_03685 [Elusimicrobiota bacterium]